jgi:hypothetical protein
MTRLSPACIAAFMLAICAAACVSRPPSPPETFFASLKQLCGKAYEGQVVSTDAADADFRAARVVMHVRTCTDDTVRIPLHVGADRSRTWVITRAGEGLELRHDHRHADGSEDALTQYGGFSGGNSSAQRTEFPVDDTSKALFTREGRAVSNTNVWAVEVSPDADRFAYELKRPQRFFRVEFDTSKPVPPPPPPWGAE